MAKKGRLQITVEYFLARLMLSALGACPRSLAVAIGRTLGFFGYFALPHLRRVGQRNLQLALPEKSKKEHRRLVRGCFDSLGRQLGEFSQFPKATPESLHTLVRDGDYDAGDYDKFQKAQAEKRGVIFVAAHLGSWELLVFAQSAFGEPLSFMVRRIDNPRIEEMIEGVRTRFGNRPLDKRDAAIIALRTLREGGRVGILVDLNSHPHEGVFVPFFGRLACTTAGVAALALRTNAVIVPICAVWDRWEKAYVIHGGPVLEVERTGDRNRDLELNTARFTEVIEKQIRAHPDQWLWVHKRWKTRPPGEPELY